MIKRLTLIVKLNFFLQQSSRYHITFFVHKFSLTLGYKEADTLVNHCTTSWRGLQARDHKKFIVTHVSL